MDFLKGKRTYFLAASAVIGTIVLLIDGKVDVGQAVVAIVTALSSVFARIGASNEAK